MITQTELGAEQKLMDTKKITVEIDPAFNDIRWKATREGFINIGVSLCGFGITPHGALSNLLIKEVQKKGDK